MKKQSLLCIILVLIALSFMWGQVSVVQAFEKESGPAAQLTAVPHAVSDKRPLKLRAFLNSYNSPLAPEASTFVTAADKHNVDWRLVAAIAGTESTFGKHVPAGSHNAWGWGIPTGAQSGIGFANWENGIEAVTAGLRKNYIDKGAETLDQIGAIYAASPVWAAHVEFFLDKIDAFTPTDPDFLDVTI